MQVPGCPAERTAELHEKMAERLKREAPHPDQSDEILSDAFRLAWGRDPRPEELSRAQRFMGEPVAQDALTDFCHVLLNSSEFLYVD